MTELVVVAIGVSVLIIFCVADGAIRRGRRRAALDAWEKGYQRGWDDHAADPTKRECMGCFESSRHKARREFSRSLDVTVQRGEEPKP